MNELRSVSAQILGLAAWLLVAFITAAIGAAASIDAAPFYKELVRPAWAPPGWLFGPVWSLLYLLMGISAWLVWRTYGFRRAGWALVLFVVQLAVNALWSWLFFAWRQGALAFFEVLVLWAMIVSVIVAFWRLGARAAALLLAPYLAWVTFAAALTLSVWQLNPDLLS